MTSSRLAHPWLAPLLSGALLLSAASATMGCDELPPRAQWRVHVGTNASVPGVGDRVRIDVVDESGAIRAGATQVFDVSTSGALPLSFGVVPTADATRLRFRLYRAESTDFGGAPLDPLIDLVGSLPEGGEGVTDVVAALGMECFGKPSVLAAEGSVSCDPVTGEMAPVKPLPTGTDAPATGSWGPPNAPCADAPPGMICVEGSTFLLGSRTYLMFGPEFDPTPQQLVHVPTYLLDADEVTVGAWRALVDDGLVDEPIAVSSLGEDTACSWTKDAGDHESLPMNCLRHEEASAGCVAMQKRLPTEAEWEFAAGGRTEERAFPFGGEGTAKEICASAVIGVAKVLQSYGSRQCVAFAPGSEGGLVAGGSPFDVNVLGLRNMGGNVAEWVADHHVPLSDSTCWGLPIALREDPLCTTDSLVNVVKGGSYVDIAYDAHVFFRRAAGQGIRVSHIGVRCAKDL